jgi:hypothetical protein
VSRTLSSSHIPPLFVDGVGDPVFRIPTIVFNPCNCWPRIWPIRSSRSPRAGFTGKKQHPPAGYGTGWHKPAAAFAPSCRYLRWQSFPVNSLTVTSPACGCYFELLSCWPPFPRVSSNGLYRRSRLLIQCGNAERAAGVFHSFSGWLIQVISLAELWVLHQGIRTVLKAHTCAGVLTVAALSLLTAVFHTVCSPGEQFSSRGARFFSPRTGTMVGHRTHHCRCGSNPWRRELSESRIFD